MRRQSLRAGCAGSPYVLGAHGQDNSQGAESYPAFVGMFRLSERNGKLVSLLPSEWNFAESNWAGGEAFACVPTFRVRCLRYGPTWASTTLYGAIQSAACCHTPCCNATCCRVSSSLAPAMFPPPRAPYCVEFICDSHITLRFPKALIYAIQGIILHPIFEGISLKQPFKK